MTEVDAQRAAEAQRQTRAIDAVARALREFGYPDVTSGMVRDTYAAMLRGDDTMPHGIIGMFARKQLQEFRDEGALR